MFVTSTCICISFIISNGNVLAEKEVLKDRGDYKLISMPAYTGLSVIVS